MRVDKSGSAINFAGCFWAIHVFKKSVSNGSFVACFRFYLGHLDMHNKILFQSYLLFWRPLDIYLEYSRHRRRVWKAYLQKVLYSFERVELILFATMQEDFDNLLRTMLLLVDESPFFIKIYCEQSWMSWQYRGWSHCEQNKASAIYSKISSRTVRIRPVM